ncbi:GxxExxY protein [bacterium]|nr:GxxExxY protein [bacterium]
MQFDPLSRRVIGCAIEVHRELGPGLLENTYENCLMREFELAGISAKHQLALPVRYKGVDIDCAYRIDILVEDELVLELKSVEALLPIHEAQLLTYLKLAKMRTGLLINFNSEVLKDGIKRRVL